MTKQHFPAFFAGKPPFDKPPRLEPLLPRHQSVSSTYACSPALLLSFLQTTVMADEAPRDAVQLAEQVAEGFAALSGEYQILFDQQKQLESKLSWAKQQVSDSPSSSLPFVMNNFSSRPAAASRL